MGPDQYGLARFAVGICVCRATCPQAALRRARRHNAGFRRRNGAAVCAVALGVRRAAAQNQRTDLQADARVVPLAMALNLNDDAGHRGRRQCALRPAVVNHVANH